MQLAGCKTNKSKFSEFTKNMAEGHVREEGNRLYDMGNMMHEGIIKMVASNLKFFDFLFKLTACRNDCSAHG